MEVKRCHKCQEVKSVEEFSKNKSTPDGLQYNCKICHNLSVREYAKANPEKDKETQKRQYKIHIVARKEYNKKWLEVNKDKAKKTHTTWRLTNKEKITERDRRYLKKNWDRIKEYNRKWYLAHRILKVKIKKDPIFYRLNSIIGSKIGHSLHGNKNGRHWENLVGYTVQDLIKHLEKQFTDGMSWNNYGFYGWHVDHIIPKSFFEFTSSDDIEFKYCWSLINLQPLWATDNKKKHNKIIYI